MKNEYTIALMAALTLTGAASFASADPVEGFLDEQFKSLEETVPGKFGINYRIRYEETDKGTGKTLDGISQRVRYSYTTEDFNGLSAMVEGETLTSVEGGFNGADKDGLGTEVNQLWAQYADKDYGKVKVGRQIYTLDDHRFIGHVGWRQNIQTFDAGTFAFTGVEKLTVNGFYLDQVNNVKDAFVDAEVYGLNASYAFSKSLTLTGFYYNIDELNKSKVDSETLGLRGTGVLTAGDYDFKYALSYANQDNAGSDANYYAGDLSTTCPKTKVTFGGGFEILEAGFRTPLATLHKFNGFADKFLGASASGLPAGLDDYYVYAGYKVPVGKGIGTKAIYHWFSPEGGGDGGSEIDLVASYKINKYLSLLGKYGDYKADDDATGIFVKDKQMFSFELNFVY